MGENIKVNLNTYNLDITNQEYSFNIVNYLINKYF